MEVVKMGHKNKEILCPCGIFLWPVYPMVSIPDVYSSVKKINPNH